MALCKYLASYTTRRGIISSLCLNFLPKGELSNGGVFIVPSWLVYVSRLQPCIETSHIISWSQVAVRLKYRIILCNSLVVLLFPPFSFPWYKMVWTKAVLSSSSLIKVFHFPFSLSGHTKFYGKWQPVLISMKHLGCQNRKSNCGYDINRTTLHEATGYFLWWEYGYLKASKLAKWEVHPCRKVGQAKNET